MILRKDRFLRDDFVYTNWAIKAEEGTTIEDLTKPEFYATAASLLKKNDTIRVIFDDGSYIADLLVLGVQKNNDNAIGANVIILNLYNISKTKQESLQVVKKVVSDEEQEESEEATESSGFKVKWLGKVKKYTIIRLSDNAIVQEDFESKEEANASLKKLIEENGNL